MSVTKNLLEAVGDLAGRLVVDDHHERVVGCQHAGDKSSTALLAAAACTCSYDADDPGAVR
jgi:hypothetical protein